MSERERHGSPDGAAGEGPNGDARTTRGEGGAVPLDDASRSSIEDRLRSMFDSVASEPVPDRFVNLLDQLERAERDGAPGSEEGARP